MAHRRDPARAQSAERQAGASRGVLGNHAARDSGSGRQSARTVARSGERTAGAPRARLSRRLQPVAGALAQSAARTVRWPRAIARAAHDRRARRRNRSVQAARILEHRSRLRASGSALLRAPAAPARQEIRAVRSHQCERCARRARCDHEVRAGPPRRQRGAVERAQAPSVAAVHHIDIATGSRAQTRFLDQPHHAHRAGSVRRRDHRRRRHGRPDHLHAYRFGESRRGRDHGIAQSHRARFRRQGVARESEFLSLQIEECAGSARSDSSDLRTAHAGERGRLSQRRSAQTCTT